MPAPVDPGNRKKLLIIGGVLAAAVIAALLIWQHYFSGPDEADIAASLRQSMQQTFDTDQRFAPYRLHVGSATVMHKSGNEYAAIVTVTTSRQIPHDISVEVIASDQGIMWKAEPGTFLFLLQEGALSPPQWSGS